MVVVRSGEGTDGAFIEVEKRHCFSYAYRKNGVVIET
jgi:hypothetical protein